MDIIDAPFDLIIHGTHVLFYNLMTAIEIMEMREKPCPPVLTKMLHKRTPLRRAPLKPETGFRTKIQRRHSAMTTESKSIGTRFVIGNISLSLDGRVSGPGGEYDMGWIVPHAITNAARDHLISVTIPSTTVLLGKKNYLGFGEYWPRVAGDESADPRDRAFSRWLNSVEKIVFSSTLKEPTWETSRIVDTDPATIVAELKKQPGGDIIVLASSSVIKSLLQADALDRLSITLCPEISGGGERLFEDPIPASSWALHQSTITESGALCLLYDRTHKGNN
jgi:dihydrofolate reductase